MIDWLFTHTPLTFLVQSLWRDEAFSYLLAHKNIFQIIFYSAFDFSPPLYYLVLHFWMYIAGSSELALRAPSLMFYFATLYMCYLYLTDIMKIAKRPAAIYLLLIAANPLLVYFAFEARMYTMMSFLAVMSFYCFSKQNIRGYFWATLAGLFTHYFFIFVPLTHFAYLRLFEDRETQKKYFNILKKVCYLFVPYFVLFLIATRGGGSSFWITKRPTFLRLPAYLYIGFDENMGFLKNYLLPMSIFLFAITGYGIHAMRSISKDAKKSMHLLILWFAIPAVITFFVSFFKPLFLGRYLIFASVGFLLFLMTVLHKLPRGAQAAILVVLFFFTWRINIAHIEHRKKPRVATAFGAIKALSKPDDVFYVTSELTFHEAQYYLGENKVYVYSKAREDIPSFVGKVLIPSSSIINSLPIYPKRAFVISPDLSYEIQSMY